MSLKPLDHLCRVHRSVRCFTVMQEHKLLFWNAFSLSRQFAQGREKEILKRYFPFPLHFNNFLSLVRFHLATLEWYNTAGSFSSADKKITIYSYTISLHVSGALKSIKVTLSLPDYHSLYFIISPTYAPYFTTLQFKVVLIISVSMPCQAVFCHAPD